MSRLVLSLLSLAAVQAFTPAKTPFALGRAGVLYFEGVGNDEVYAAASACLDEECSVDTADSRVRRATSPAPNRAPVDIASVRAGRHSPREAPDSGAGAREDRPHRRLRARRDAHGRAQDDLGPRGPERPQPLHPRDQGRLRREAQGALRDESYGLSGLRCSRASAGTSAPPPSGTLRSGASAPPPSGTRHAW